MTEQRTKCSGGLPPEVCCVGHPWDVTDLVAQVMRWGEPLPQVVIDIAAKRGIDPHALDSHVEAEHGWEAHDIGYDGAVRAAADCVTAGRCLVTAP